MFTYEIERQIMGTLGEANSLVGLLTEKLQRIELPETDYEILSLIDQSNKWLDRMNQLHISLAAQNES